MRAVGAAAAIGLALLLAVFLRPTGDEDRTLLATPTPFEYDVLPGVQQLSRLSYG